MSSWVDVDWDKVLTEVQQPPRPPRARRDPARWWAALWLVVLFVGGALVLVAIEVVLAVAVVVLTLVDRLRDYVREVRA